VSRSFVFRKHFPSSQNHMYRDEYRCYSLRVRCNGLVNYGVSHSFVLHNHFPSSQNDMHIDAYRCYSRRVRCNGLVNYGVSHSLHWYDFVYHKMFQSSQDCIYSRACMYHRFRGSSMCVHLEHYDILLLCSIDILLFLLALRSTPSTDLTASYSRSRGSPGVLVREKHRVYSLRLSNLGATLSLLNKVTSTISK